MKKTASIKKAIALLITVLVIGGVISAGLASNAVSPVQLTVTSASGKAGDEVTISLNITADSGLTAADLLLTYDTDKLVYKSKSFGPAKGEADSAYSENYANSGNIRTIYYGPVHNEGITAGGSMLSITFSIKTGWTGSTPITLIARDDAFLDKDYNVIPYNITNGSISIGVASATTVPASTAPATTEPSLTAATTVSSDVTGTGNTTAQVPVPIEEIKGLLGPDAGNWNSDYGTLNEEQKVIIREHYEKQETPVEITPDGIYYIQTTVPATTLAESTAMSDGDAGKPVSSNTKIAVFILLAVLILAASFIGAYMYRKKKTA